MTDKGRKYLSDIVNSINHIESFLIDVNSFDQYKSNFLVKSAVERHLEIIGEAVNYFLKESPENQLDFAKKIISLRNRLIHSYDNIDDRIIWDIVKRNLDSLKLEAIEKIK